MEYEFLRDLAGIQAVALHAVLWRGAASLETLPTALPPLLHTASRDTQKDNSVCTTHPRMHYSALKDRPLPPRAYSAQGTPH